MRRVGSVALVTCFLTSSLIKINKVQALLEGQWVVSFIAVRGFEYLRPR